MINFETVKYYYDKKLWSKKMVGNAVKKGYLTEEEYKEITGEDFAG